MKYYDVIPEAWAPLGGGRYNPFEDEMLKGIAAKYNKSVGQVITKMECTKRSRCYSKINTCRKNKRKYRYL